MLAVFMPVAVWGASLCLLQAGNCQTRVSCLSDMLAVIMPVIIQGAPSPPKEAHASSSTVGGKYRCFRHLQHVTLPCVF